MNKRDNREREKTKNRGVQTRYRIQGYLFMESLCQSKLRMFRPLVHHHIIMDTDVYVLVPHIFVGAIVQYSVRPSRRSSSRPWDGGGPHGPHVWENCGNSLLSWCLLFAFIFYGTRSTRKNTKVDEFTTCRSQVRELKRLKEHKMNFSSSLGFFQLCIFLVWILTFQCRYCLADSIISMSVGDEKKIEHEQSEAENADSIDYPMSEILVPIFWQQGERRIKLTELLEVSKELGISVNTQNVKGWSAMTFAAEYGDHEAIDVLLTVYGADINVQEDDGWTPLLFACYHGNTQLIDKLISVYGADTSLLNYDGIGASTLLRRRGLFRIADEVTRKGLIRATEHISSTDPSQREIILRALQDSASNPIHGDIHTTELNYADFQNAAGWGPMHFCADANDVHCLRELLHTYSADVNRPENDGWSPLMFACFHGHIESVTEILKYEGRLVRVEDNNGIFGKVDVEHRNARGITALGLVRQRLFEVPPCDQENYEAIAVLLSKYQSTMYYDMHSSKDNFLMHEYHGSGFFSGAMRAVGTFFFGQNEDVHQVL